MATYTNYCRRCGWRYIGREGGPTRCPCCDSIEMSDNVITEFDSPEEKAAHARACKEERKSFILLLICIAVVLAWVFPGALVLMLLHVMVDIDSGFLNWLLSMVFSGVIFMICKGNMINFLKVDVWIIGISTIIGWCVSDFRPWSFAISTYFFNPIFALIWSATGILILNKCCPQLLDKFK